MQDFNWLSTGYLPISKIKIDNVSISGDMSLYRGTFDSLIEGRLQFKRQSPYRGLSHTVESVLRGRWKEWTVLLIWHHGQGFPKQSRARHDGFLSSDDAWWYRCLVCRSPRGLLVALSSTRINVIISLLLLQIKIVLRNNGIQYVMHAIVLIELWIWEEIWTCTISQFLHICIAWCS